MTSSISGILFSHNPVYIQGVPEKSTRQIVIDFEHLTARTDIGNDSESKKLTSKQNKNLFIEKV